MMKKECRVVIYKEGLLGSLFFGEAKADPDKMSQFLYCAPDYSGAE